MDDGHVITTHPNARRLRVRVRGAVQGVGFRPYVFALARRYDLAGFVMNDSDGVLIEIEGQRTGDFVHDLGREAPPLARIDAIACEGVTAHNERQFRIASSVAGRSTTLLPADAATCEQCRDDLFDPGSRFHLYPFVNCTHCGPRYTVTRNLPYDRAHTAMAHFAMCPDCAREYRDPSSRRFHAEPIACPKCGPRLSHSIERIVEVIRSGGIVALKGLGGFQLLCDARNETAVATLRRRKDRDAKPFAVMVASVASLAGIAKADAAERALLESVERPIVLLTSLGALAPSIAPNLNRLGVMLPCTPLHDLIFHAAAGSPEGRDWQRRPVDFVIVATSANPGGEPLVIDDADAERRLGGIADLVVTHDRPIFIRADDSVVTVVDGAPALIRRARGYVPRPISLPREAPPILALGGHLKVTVTVTRRNEAFVSQHIGDLDSVETVRFLDETVDHLLGLLAVTPEVIAHDLHPDFMTTRLAERYSTGHGAARLVPVQHHHAHVAAVAAEYGIDEPVLGIVLDGYGYGAGGGNWGGEVLLLDGPTAVRLGHLKPLAMPGGDKAACEPWRMAAGLLHDLGRGEEIATRFGDVAQAADLGRWLSTRAAPRTTSAGRLFDAVAGLLGTCRIQSYEGQAAMELEALVRRPSVLPDGWRIEGAELSFAPLLTHFAHAAPDPREGAEIFHGTLAAGLAEFATSLSRDRGLTRIALGGGCFLNRVLAETLAANLRAAGLEPLLPRRIPPNDGGLSLGQAWVAAQAATTGDVDGKEG
jgi:hydrogenase maturation protein HypF